MEHKVLFITPTNGHELTTALNAGWEVEKMLATHNAGDSTYGEKIAPVFIILSRER